MGCASKATRRSPGERGSLTGLAPTGTGDTKRTSQAIAGECAARSARGLINQSLVRPATRTNVHPRSLHYCEK